MKKGEYQFYHINLINYWLILIIIRFTNSDRNNTLFVSFNCRFFKLKMFQCICHFQILRLH